jgi:FkbM family methyltransferase
MKEAIRTWFRAVGLDVKRYRPDSNALLWLKRRPIRTILDIGANSGQFANWIHSLLPEARIYSFEPLADCCRALETSMRRVPQFTALNIALGDHHGSAEIHRHAFSPTSSLLPSGTVLTKAFPHTAREEYEKVSLRRLDDVAQDLVMNDEILVKIDVQGYEDRVILGGKSVLSRAAIVIVETSFVELYEGQPLFHGVYQLLRELGLTYGGSLDQLANPADGRILQADAVFFKGEQ